VRRRCFKTAMRDTRVLTILLLLCIAAGCSREDYRPLKNGYGYVVHRKGIIHERVWADLRRLEDDKPILLWPHLGDPAKVQIHNETVLFIGGMGVSSTEGQVLVDTLIGFSRSSGGPADLTDAFFRKWCAETGVPFANISEDALVSLSSTNDSVKLTFLIMKGSPPIDVVGTNAFLNWWDIETMIRDAVKTGTRHKEKWSGVEYWQKN
jgi:hypothetical protein